MPPTRYVKQLRNCFDYGRTTAIGLQFVDESR